MRREWAPLIKNRQWIELESIAKRDPSQLLCDTVAELSRGFSEKADKRALKRILFLLRQSGYQPSELEEEEVPLVEAKRFTAGFILSADSNGDTAVTYAHEKKGRVLWLTAYLNARTGISGAGEDTTSSLEAESKLQRLRSANVKPYASAEIPAEFALWRIREALGRTAKVPSVIAFWRSTIESAEPVEHPGRAIARTEASGEEMRRVVVEFDSTILWRLELGAATPLLKELYEAQQSELELTEDQRRERNQRILAKARAELITPEVIADHASRLYDLAYIQSLRGEGNPGLLVAAAQDLEANGAESDYAKALLDKTVVMLVETMKAAGQRGGQPAPA